MASAAVPRRPGDTAPYLPAAGIGGGRRNGSSSQCLQPDIDPANQRPPTPAEMRRYRKSYQRQPGQKFISAGLVGQKLPPEHHRYGIRLRGGDKAQDCFEQVPKTELQDFANELAEAQYQSHQREPLGRSYVRGHKLSAATQDPNFRFGVTSSSSETSKGLIYYDEPIQDQRVAPQYPDLDPQFHRERDITRQVNRGYDWKSAGIDPVTQRFGRVEIAEKDGVQAALKHDPLDTNIGSKRVHEIRNYSHDRLGQGRELRGTLRKLGSDFVFGRASTPDEWGAKKCIGGAYTIPEQMPDKDLGVSVRTLDKYTALPHDNNRIYGIPSIRYDIDAPRLRSVADPQNYGDEHNAKGLLYPSKFAADGVEESEFLRERTPDEVRLVFQKMDMEFSDKHFNQICDMARKDFRVLSVDSFRHAYNKLKMEG